MHFCQQCKRACIPCSEKSAPVVVAVTVTVPVTPAEMHNPPPHCGHIHCLVSINIKQASVSVNGCLFFSAWRNSVTHFCFIWLPCQTSFYQCPSAAICHTATICNRKRWKGSTCTAIPPTSVSDIVGQHHKLWGITFRTALLDFKEIWYR